MSTAVQLLRSSGSLQKPGVPAAARTAACMPPHGPQCCHPPTFTTSQILPPLLPAHPPTQVFFDVNGVPRVVEVVDENVGKESATKRAVRDKADPSNIGSVPAPMAGEVGGRGGGQGFICTLLLCLRWLGVSVYQAPGWRRVVRVVGQGAGACAPAWHRRCLLRPDSGRLLRMLARQQRRAAGAMIQPAGTFKGAGSSSAAPGCRRGRPASCALAQPPSPTHPATHTRTHALMETHTHTPNLPDSTPAGGGGEGRPRRQGGGRPDAGGAERHEDGDLGEPCL